MKFTIALSEFQKALQSALQAVPPKSTLPVLESFHFRLEGSQLQITATDMELTVITRLTVDGAADGEILVPARKLSDIVKAFGNAGMMQFSEGKGYNITLKTDVGKYVLYGSDSADFPATPDFTKGTRIRLSGKDAMRIASMTPFAASRDEYRPAMTGILFDCDRDRINAVSTDGYRFVKVVTQLKEGDFLPEKEKFLPDKKVDAILPVRAVSLLRRIKGDVTMLVNDTHAKFTTDDSTIISRVIEEHFPPYEKVIPQGNDKFVRLGTSELSASVKRVALFSDSDTNKIRFVIAANKLTIFAEDKETGNTAREEIVCDYAGESFEIAFNHRYFEEAVAHLSEDGTDTVVLSFSHPSRAVLMKPLRNGVETDDVVMLVMPMRL